QNIARATIPITDADPEDPSSASMNKKYGPLLKELEQVIGKTSIELNVKSADVRTRETNMADFIADTYRKATGADVALANGGSIRADTKIERSEERRVGERV